MWGRSVNARNRYRLGLAIIVLCFLSGMPVYAQQAEYMDEPLSAPMPEESSEMATESAPGGVPKIGNTTVAQEEILSQPARPVPAEPGKPVALAPAVSPNFVEAGINYSAVSKNQGDWFGQGIRGEYQYDASDRFKAEYLHQRQFRDSGSYFSVGNVHSFDEEWYSDVSVGTSTGGFFLPTYRVDAFLNKKWLEGRNFVTTIGYGRFQSRDIYSDNSIFFGTTYYFHPYWIFENGIRYNISSPGSVNSASGFLAITNGRVQNYFVTLRYGYGREAYQLIGPANLLSEFYSHNTSLIWRQWMLSDWGFSNDWGFSTRVDYYTNPNYHRVGGYFGVFKEF